MSFNQQVDDIFDDVINSVISEQAPLWEKEAWKDNEFPVDIWEFIDNRFYLGGQADLDEGVRDCLWSIEDPLVRTIFMEVGKGGGKSEVASIEQLYGAYIYSRMNNPHKRFRIAQADLIAFINVSINKDQARDVVFQKVKHKWQTSPYFKEVGGTILTGRILLPGNLLVYCGHSGFTAFLGYATARAALDEMNFMVDSQKRNSAEDLYTALSGSLKTRFEHFYKMVCISSASAPSSFLHRLIVQSRDGLVGEYEPVTRQADHRALFCVEPKRLGQ